MAYDEKLAARVRGIVGRRGGVTEKEMFGGIAFLLDGKMFVGVLKQDLMVRVGKEANDDALSKPHARPMDFTGKPMAGYVYVAPGGTAKDASLKTWVDWGAKHAATLPAKKKKR